MSEITLSNLVQKFNHKYRGDSWPFDFIEQAHFAHGLPVDASRRLFKKSINLVEVEVFSYCNRRCWHCPNSVIDRQTKNIYLDKGLYEKILNDLKSIDYDKTFACSHYNEPLADDIILERISLARRSLPRALIHINTNGDYLTREFLARLYDAGLRSIIVMAYTDNGESYDDEKTRASSARLMEKIGVSLSMTEDTPGENIGFFGRFKDMRINMHGRNFLSNGTNRGGLVPIPSRYTRLSPCLIPFNRITIEYDGSVMPCCNLRGDHPDHRAHIISRLGKDSGNIFEIYVSAVYVNWRRKVARYGPKDRPCDICHFAEQKISGRVIQKVESYYKKRGFYGEEE